jgi:hypothetical protein
VNHDSNNENCSTEANVSKQNTLPDIQLRNEKNMHDDIPHIISRILSLAREIGCLSEYRVPVEDGSTNPVSSKGSR